MAERYEEFYISPDEYDDDDEDDDDDLQDNEEEPQDDDRRTDYLLKYLDDYAENVKKHATAKDATRHFIKIGLLEKDGKTIAKHYRMRFRFKKYRHKKLYALRSFAI